MPMASLEVSTFLLGLLILDIPEHKADGLGLDGRVGEDLLSQLLVVLLTAADKGFRLDGIGQQCATDWAARGSPMNR